MCPLLEPGGEGEGFRKVAGEEGRGAWERERERERKVGRRGRE
jgi:hypothetical protein